MRKGRRLLPIALLVLLLVSPYAPVFAATAAPPSDIPIKHIFIIVQENHSFDNYFGYYPGVNGLGNAQPQLNPNSSALVSPFEINTPTIPEDLCHMAPCAQADFNGGKMNGFLSKGGENNAETMGYFNPDLIPYYWDYAYQYVLMDNWYTPFMGPSLPNHIYLLAGQGGGITDNNVQFNFTFPTITTLLDAAKVSWVYYAGSHSRTNGWNPLPSDLPYMKAHPLLQGLNETTTFPSAIKKANFPSVAWLMPETDQASEHPPYNITTGEQTVVGEINDIMHSSYWNSSAIVLTWDDYGGWYDNASPPQVDKYGYGFRVPAMIISPFAKQGFVDSTLSEDASTLKLIETVFHLPSLGTRDVKASDLLEAFNFDQTPRSPLVLPGPYIANHYPLTLHNGTVLGPLPQGPGGKPIPSPVAPDYDDVGFLVATVSLLVVVMAAVSVRLRPQYMGP